MLLLRSSHWFSLVPELMSLCSQTLNLGFTGGKPPLSLLICRGGPEGLRVTCATLCVPWGVRPDAEGLAGELLTTARHGGKKPVQSHLPPHLHPQLLNQWALIGSERNAGPRVSCHSIPHLLEAPAALCKMETTVIKTMLPSSPFPSHLWIFSALLSFLVLCHQPCPCHWVCC